MMKKISFLKLILLLFITQMSLAQIKVGAKAGISLGNLSDSDTNIYSGGFSSKSGSDLGVFVELQITNTFSIRPEVIYTRKGGRREGLQPVQTEALLPFLQANGIDLPTLNQFAIASGGSTITLDNPLYADYNSQSELNYIEIPLLARFRFGKKELFYVEVGPYIGILTNAEQRTSGSSLFYVDNAGQLPLRIPNPAGTPPFFNLPESSFNALTDVKDNLETTNYGVHFGVGFAREYDQQHEISFGVRATYGFVPIQKDNTFGESKVGGIIFTFAYSYIFKKKVLN